MSEKEESFEARRNKWKKKVNRYLNLTTAYEDTSGEKVDSRIPETKRDRKWYDIEEKQ